MLGQGQSTKPVLGIELTEHADLLAGLLTYLQVGRTHLAGISFGGAASSVSSPRETLPACRSSQLATCMSAGR